MSHPNTTLWQGDYGNWETLEADYPQFWSILDKSEQDYASAMKNDRLRRNYVEVHARLRTLLGEAVNVAPERLRLDKSQHGKPYLVDYPELAFNLSHTGNKLVVAMAYHCELGVDIEQCKPRTTLAALVDKCFAEEEKNDWLKLPKSEQTLAFYRFWTRKEAFVKATGRGIGLGLKQCVVNPQDPTRFLSIPEDYGQTDEWLIQDFDVSDSICGAMVTKTRNKE